MQIFFYGKWRMIFLQKKVVYQIVEREGNETQETRKAATGRFFCARRIFF